VRAITRDDLIAFRSARLRPQGALLVVAGDLSMADARKLATQHLGSWTGAAAPTAAVKPPPARTKTEILLVHRPGSVQSNIVVGNTTFTPNDPRFYAATVANRVLGGGADARLFMILREQKSWTYGAYSSIRRPKGIGSFEATAEVRTEVTDSALVEMLAQVRRIGTEAVPAPELEAAKSSLVGSFPLTIETAEQVAGAVASAKLLGLSPDYLQTYRTRLAAVTPEQLRAAAQETMRGNALLAVVVGDATKIYDKLQAIAPVKVVSAEGTPLAASDLEVKAGAVQIDVSRLVPRSDSFTVMVQGNPFGWSRTALEKTASGFRVTEETQLGPIMQQSTEVLLSPRGEVLQAKQTGKVQGQELKLEASYAGGRVKASGTMPSPQGAKPVAVDTTVPPGTVDNNAIQALMPALKWAPDAKWTFNVFAPGEGQLRAMTLSVTGTESVTVPAGTFEVYRAELTGGRAPVTFLVTKAAPHRLGKVAQAGAPVEMVLVK
jgi:zinc protease